MGPPLRGLTARRGGRYGNPSDRRNDLTPQSAAFLLFIALPITEATVLVFSAVAGLMWLGTVPLTSGLISAALHWPIAEAAEPVAD